MPRPLGALPGLAQPPPELSPRPASPSVSPSSDANAGGGGSDPLSPDEKPSEYLKELLQEKESLEASMASDNTAATQHAMKLLEQGKVHQSMSIFYVKLF